jgi:hypothetical protein
VRTILFFDDWAILTRQGTDRRWFTAEPWTSLTPWHDPQVALSSVASVIRDGASGRWRMWGAGITSLDNGDEGFCMCAYGSDDGFDWQALPQDPLADLRTEVAEHTIHRDYCPRCKKHVEPVVGEALPKAAIGNSLVALTGWLHYGLGVTTAQVRELVGIHLYTP